MIKFMVQNLKEIKSMNIVAEIGTDIIEISRFRKKPFESNKSFYELIFSDSEIKHCKKFSNPFTHFAGLFAAKESIIKLFNKPLTMKQIGISWNPSGKPIVKIKNNQIYDIKISISHSKLFAIAFAFGFFYSNKE